jgi:hypothetical protein
LEPKGGSSTTTWRTSSTAVSGCRPDAAAGTHQAQLARPGPDWARKVPAATLLHVGQRRRYPSCSEPHHHDHSRGCRHCEQADPPKPRWACRARSGPSDAGCHLCAEPPRRRHRDASSHLRRATASAVPPASTAAEAGSPPCTAACPPAPPGRSTRRVGKRPPPPAPPGLCPAALAGSGDGGRRKGRA